MTPNPNKRPRRHGQRDFVALGTGEPRSRECQAQTPEGILHEECNGRERQNDRETPRDHLIHQCGRPTVEPEPYEDRARGRNAADGESPDDAPIDAPAEAK